MSDLSRIVQQKLSPPDGIKGAQVNALTPAQKTKARTVWANFDEKQEKRVERLRKALNEEGRGAKFDFSNYRQSLKNIGIGDAEAAREAGVPWDPKSKTILSTFFAKLVLEYR